MPICVRRARVMLLVGAIVSLLACAGPDTTFNQEAFAPGSQSLPQVALLTEVAPFNGVANLDVVALFSGPMPTGVAVSRDNRIFVSFPRWGDQVQFTVAELKNGQLSGYPNTGMNNFGGFNGRDNLVSVQSVVVDAQNRLWMLDSGNVSMGANLPGGPKLVAVDLANNRVVQIFHFPSDVALTYSYLNDVRFDLKANGGKGFAYITDSSTQGNNGIVVLDLSSGKSWRRLDGHRSVMPERNFAPTVEGQRLMVRAPMQAERPLSIGADGIALSPNGQTLYYRPLASRHLYSVPTTLLQDPNVPADRVGAGVKDFGDIGFASDGMVCDSKGMLYLTDYEHHAIRMGDPATGRFDAVLVSDPRMIWPDTLAIGPDQNLYITVNQLNRQPRFHGGTDQRRPPYVLFRTPIGAGPSVVRAGN